MEQINNKYQATAEAISPSTTRGSSDGNNDRADRMSLGRSAYGGGFDKDNDIMLSQSLSDEDLKASQSTTMANLMTPPSQSVKAKRLRSDDLPEQVTTTDAADIASASSKGNMDSMPVSSKENQKALAQEIELEKEPPLLLKRRRLNRSGFFFKEDQ